MQWTSSIDFIVFGLVLADILELIYVLPVYEYLDIGTIKQYQLANNQQLNLTFRSPVNSVNCGFKIFKNV